MHSFRYHAACVRSHTRLTQAEVQTNQKHVRSGPAVLSAEWQRNPKVHSAIRNNECWTVLGNPPKGSTHGKGSAPGADGSAHVGGELPKPLSAADIGADSASTEQTSEETAVLMDLFGENTLTKTDIITDPQILKSLAHMHESMAWFAERVGEMAKALASKTPDKLAWMWDDVGPVIVPPVPVEGDDEGGGDGESSSGGDGGGGGKHGAEEAGRTGGGKSGGADAAAGAGIGVGGDGSHGGSSSSTQAAFAGMINRQIKDAQIQRLKQIARGFRGISKACLVLLRLELRCHTLMHLVPAIRKSNYQLVNPEQAEADQQVLVLCRDMSSVNELLSASLDPTKMEFLFHGQ